MSRFVVLLLAGLVLGLGSALASPAVLILEAADNEESRLRESAFVTELFLAVDDVPIRRAAVEPPDLFGRPVASQLEALRPLLEDEGILAVGWLDPATEDPLRVQLVFASEGRAVLRLVEEPAGPGAASSLALAVRELVVAALLPPSGLQSSAATAEPEPRAETVSSVPTQYPWALSLQAALAVGLARPSGPDPRPGLLVSVHRRLVGRLGLSVGFSLRGARGESSSTLGLGGRLALSWLPGNEIVGIGPTGAVEVDWLRFSAEGSDGEERSASQAQIRLAPGLGFRLGKGRWSFVLAVSADFLPLRSVVRLRSDGSSVLDTGPAELLVTLGVRVGLGRGVERRSPDGAL